MDSYLAERRSAPRSPEDEPDQVAMSLELLSSALNNYGHEHLSRVDAKAFFAAYEDAEDENTFSRMFGPNQLMAYIDEFVNWFLIRKAIMPVDQTEQTIEDVRGFVEWLAERDEIGTGQARKALGAIATASVDVPSAERLARILHDIARKNTEAAAARRTHFDETIEDYLVIERVAPGRILVPRRRRPDQGAGGGQRARPPGLDGELSRGSPRCDLADPRDRQRLPRHARSIGVSGRGAPRPLPGRHCLTGLIDVAVWAA